MDAQTHPDGVLEEVEASANLISKSAKAGNKPWQCAYDGMVQKGILVRSKHTSNANSPLQRKAGKGWIRKS